MSQSISNVARMIRQQKVERKDATDQSNIRYSSRRGDLQCFPYVLAISTIFTSTVQFIIIDLKLQ